MRTTLPSSTWASGLADTYYKVSDGQTFVLHLGQTTTTEKPAETQTDPEDPENPETPATPATLVVDNAKYIKITLNKKRTNGWLGGEFNMDGVTIGVYRRVAVEEGETENAWEKVDDADTENGGNVAFTNLKRADENRNPYEYALVEMNSNSDVYLPYQDGDWKQSNPPTTIPSGELENYNAKVLSASEIIQTKTDYDLDKMYNRSHWVQFHITKYLDDHTLTENRAANRPDLYDAQGHA